MRKEIHEIANKGWPVWGTLAWVRLTNCKTDKVHSCLVVPGRMIEGEYDMINPLGKHMRDEIDHIVLTSKNIALPISDLYFSVKILINVIEPILSREFGELPASGADLFMCAEFSITQETNTTK